MEEKQLDLVIKEKTLGSLITNAKDIKSFVAAKLETYSVDSYNGDEKQAAKDKAELNAASKKLNDERIKLEKEFMQPFQEFKDIVKETTNLIDEAAKKLDLIVKTQQEQEKAEKRKNIEGLWQAKNFTLVTLDRVFNPRWLNKTTKLTAIDAELNSIIQTITDDLKALESSEDAEDLKAFYLSTLSLQLALQKGAELKKNRERLAAEKKAATEEEKRKAEEQQKEVIPPENKCEVPPVPKPNNTPKIPMKYYFCCTAQNRGVFEEIKKIAEETKIKDIHSILLVGDAAQIEQFKQKLAEKQLVYSKSAITNLYVEGIE